MQRKILTEKQTERKSGKIKYQSQRETYTRKERERERGKIHEQKLRRKRKGKGDKENIDVYIHMLCMYILILDIACTMFVRFTGGRERERERAEITGVNSRNEGANTIILDIYVIAFSYSGGTLTLDTFRSSRALQRPICSSSPFSDTVDSYHCVILGFIVVSSSVFIYLCWAYFAAFFHSISLFLSLPIQRATRGDPASKIYRTNCAAL